MADILFVSKPVGPPWNDSSKNLVRDVVTGMTRHHPIVMGRADGAFALPNGTVEPLYAAGTGGYSPAMKDNLRVLSRLAFGKSAGLWHFFFAPNPRTSSASAFCRTLRGAKTVQTVCSAPRDGLDLKKVLFADVTVVLSRHTEARLRDEGGIDAAKVARIPPSAPALSTIDDATRTRYRTELGLPTSAPLVLYAGDLEFGGGAELVIDACAGLPSDAVLVMACRPKTAAAKEAEQNLRARVSAADMDGRTLWLGETSRILDLLAAVDVVALPSTNLYAKMDYPLVLLEAMALERSVIVAQSTPAAELADGGGALAVAPDADALRASLAGLLGDSAARESLGKRARAHVLAEHDAIRMAQRYEALYDALLS